AGAGLLAGIGSGVVFFVAKGQEEERDQKNADAKNIPQGDTKSRIVDSANSYHDAALNDQLIALSLLGGTAVLLGVGAFLWFTAPNSAPTTGKLRVVPLVGPNVSGLGLGGAF